MESTTIQTILTLIGLTISGVGIVFFNKSNNKKLSLSFSERREADLTKVIILEQKTKAIEAQGVKDSAEHARIFTKLEMISANLTEIKIDIAQKWNRPA